jgi:hypothetical protein
MSLMHPTPGHRQSNITWSAASLTFIAEMCAYELLLWPSQDVCDAKEVDWCSVHVARIGAMCIHLGQD